MKNALTLCITTAAVAMLTGCGGKPDKSAPKNEAFNLNDVRDYAWGDRGNVVPGFKAQLGQLERIYRFDLRAIGVDSQDRILATGTIKTNENGTRLFVARFMPDGSPDESCGPGGFQFVRSTGFDVPIKVDPLPGGAMLITSNGDSYRRHQKITESCLPDQTYGNSSFADVGSIPRLPNQGLDSASGLSNASALVINDDGSFVATANGSNNSYIYQIDPNGQVDLSFNNGVGVLSQKNPITTLGQKLVDLAKSTNGSLKALGQINDTEFGWAYLYPFVQGVTASGSIDGLFGTNGFVTQNKKVYSQVLMTISDPKIATDQNNSYVFHTAQEMDGSYKDGVGTIQKYTDRGLPDLAWGPGGLKRYSVFPGVHLHTFAKSNGDYFIVAGSVNESVGTLGDMAAVAWTFGLMYSGSNAPAAGSSTVFGASDFAAGVMATAESGSNNLIRAINSNPLQLLAGGFVAKIDKTNGQVTAAGGIKTEREKQSLPYYRAIFSTAVSSTGAIYAVPSFGGPGAVIVKIRPDF